MPEQATLVGGAPVGEITIKIEVTTQVNISAFVARQRANRYLIVQVGDQLCAGDPELVVGTVVRWRVPVQYAPSQRGALGIVGHLLVDAATGELSIADDRTVEDLLKGAEALYARAALSTGA